MAGDKSFGTDAYEPDDLLMAAITGTDVPDELAHDAGYQAALGDLDQLRCALRELGDELAAEPAGEPVPAPAAVPPRVRPARVRTRRLFAVSVRVAVAACALALFGGLFWLGAQNGMNLDAADSDKSAGEGVRGPAHDSGGDHKEGEGQKGAASRAPDSDSAQSDAGFSRAEQIACTKILVEGKATKLVPRKDGKVDVTVKVDRWYRPERAVAEEPTMTVALPAPVASDIERGELVLISVYRHAEDGYDAETGWGVGDVRPELLEALPESRTLDCPKPLR
ncbi:hypothetical protein G6045_38105 [Streptomyces sp. YC504]|uniref:Uncharacterized protein n=1 Tax=Streptomyces mesophilus TaxID=1775132 RepID=A0A6G4XW70_9ACTN|nr:hypothetical protein [Streptomyces mesophilus]NGO81432.1 hypothetical protein [Streptomyces mesophilus]